MDLFSAKFVFLALVALVVLGPDKLPGALRTAGRLLAEARRLSAGAAEQSRAVMHEAGLAEPLEELRAAAQALRQPLGAAPGPFSPPAPPGPFSPPAPPGPFSPPAPPGPGLGQAAVPAPESPGPQAGPDRPPVGVGP